MKKSIERFKVRIDQNLNRTEKSVALTPDLIKIEETIGVYKQVCTTLQKKFSEGLQGFGKGTDGQAIDRRLKKTSDFVLGQTMSEVGRNLVKQNSISCLGQVLVEIGGLCSGLAHNQVQHEIFVEQIIIGKLQEVLNTDLPNILTGRKQLDRLILELDTAKARLDKAREEEQHGTPGTGARIEKLVEDLDDMSRKVEQARDNLAADMMMFLARDDELAGLVTQYLEFRLKLHIENTTQLEQIKPRLETIRSTRRGFPIFGCALKDHIESFGLESRVAYPIQLCVSKLIELGLEEEGLFRLAAGSSKVKRLRAEIEAGQATLSSLDGCDHHVLTAIIKTYLRELPSPLLGEKLYEDWLEAGNLQGEDRFDAIWNLLQSEHLPRENYRNIHYLFKFLHEVTLHSDKNKMTASNLAIVITPNVIWSTEAVQDVLDVGVGGVLAQVVELIINQQSWFFQNDSPIVWNDKLTPLGTCIPVHSDENPPPMSALTAGIASAMNIPMSITSSPLPAHRDKNKKSKKAPAPPPSYSPNGIYNLGFNGSATPSSSAGAAGPGTPSSVGGGGSGSPPGSSSPVQLRHGSPGKLRTSESMSHRSKSVEAHRQLQHPSQPPPKPPTTRSSQEPGSRASLETSIRSRGPGDTGSRSRGSTDTPSRSRASTNPPSMPSSREDSGAKDSDTSGSSDENAPHSPAHLPTERSPHSPAHPSTERSPARVVHSGGVYTVHSGLYPDLSEDIDVLKEASPLTEPEQRPMPVPAPRFSKPALPSKPEGLSRNLSVRTSGGGGGGGVSDSSRPRESLEKEARDSTKL